ncbi:MAG: histidine kinase [Acidimicrobiia bacterium]
MSTVDFPWGETILMNEAEDPALLSLFLLAMIAMIIYIVAADVILLRRGERGDATVLAIGIGWFVFTIVQENLVLVGVIDGVFLSDFGFLGFVLALSIASTNRVIETEEELRRYQANLETMVDDRTAELETAQAELLGQAAEAATVAERTRLARDLHDVVTQLLFSINLVAGSLPRLWRRDPEMAERSTAELQRLTRGALAEMRTLLRELRPQTIPETDLTALVTHLVDGLSARHDVPAQVTGEFNGQLPQEAHIAVYRIAQEALNNAAKHASPSSLVVVLEGEDSWVHLSITDDGSGFDVDDISLDHMGVQIMRERAEGIGAVLDITSESDIGTTVDLRWGRH